MAMAICLTIRGSRGECNPPSLLRFRSPKISLVDLDISPLRVRYLKLIVLLGVHPEF